jgi:hypothetical protein
MTSDSQALDSALMVAVDHVVFSCAVTFCAIVLTSEAQIREDCPWGFYLVEIIVSRRVRSSQACIPPHHPVLDHPVLDPGKIDIETDVTLTYWAKNNVKKK